MTTLINNENNTNQLETLQAQLQAQIEAAATKAKEQAQIAMMQARIDLVTSEAFQALRARQFTEDFIVKSLEDSINKCKYIVESTPVQDIKRRKLKEWNGRPVYGLGKQLELLHNLCTGIVYAVDQHKLPMLALTPINVLEAERFLSALGNTAYYSATYSTIVEEKPYDVAQIKNSATLLAESLGITVDTSMVTDKYMSERFAAARAKADLTKLEEDNTPHAQLIM